MTEERNITKNNIYKTLYHRPELLVITFVLCFATVVMFYVD